MDRGKQVLLVVLYLFLACYLVRNTQGKKRVESGSFDFIKDFLKSSVIEHKNSFVCDIT